MTFTVQMKRELSRQFVLDVLTTAVESGYSAVRYWGAFLDVQRDGDLNVTQFTVAEDEEAKEDGTGYHDWYVVTPETIVQAIQMVLDDPVMSASVVGNYVVRAVRDDDAGDIDAEAADLLVQLAAFDGTVIYG